MSVVGWGQIGLLAFLIGVLVKPLGGYLARVYAGERTVLKPILGPIETALYRLARLDASVEQKWPEYVPSPFSSSTPSGQLRSIFSCASKVCCRSIRNSFQRFLRI